MKEKNSSTSTYVALVVIAIAALGLYFYYKGSPTDDSSSLVTTNSIEASDAQAASARVLSLLDEISSLKIDDTIFKSAVFNSLVDYSRTIPEQNVGRVNPFAPIAGHSIAQDTISAPAIKK